MKQISKSGKGYYYQILKNGTKKRISEKGIDKIIKSTSKKNVKDIKFNKKFNKKMVGGTVIKPRYLEDIKEIFYSFIFHIDRTNEKNESRTYKINFEYVRIEIFDTVKKIPDETFSAYQHLLSIKMSDTVTSIGKNAFKDCCNLQSIKLSKSLTKIESGTFSDCINLIEITIPESVTEIQKSAFYRCRRLTSIRIPASVTKIGMYAFSRCYNLTKIIIEGENTIIEFKKPLDDSSKSKDKNNKSLGFSSTVAPGIRSRIHKLQDAILESATSTDNNLNSNNPYDGNPFYMCFKLNDIKYPATYPQAYINFFEAILVNNKNYDKYKSTNTKKINNKGITLHP